MKKVLILGAGIYQLPLIKRACELGYYCIVCSIDGNYPGFEFADKIYYINTTDINACLKVAIDENIDGVCTTGTDVALPTLGAICDAMNLKGISKFSADLSSNKKLMKEAFVNLGVRTARHLIVHTADECVEACDLLGFPVIFKVTDSSGSRGIIKVEESDSILPAYTNVCKSTSKQYIVVEQFIEGVEFGAQAFVHNGILTFTMPHGDMVFKGDTGVPIGHYVPYQLSERQIVDLELQLKLSVEALRINNAAINADFILHDDEIFVLEIGARAGATCLPELVSYHLGFDYYEYILRVAMDDEIPVLRELTHKPCAAELIISEKTGTILEITLPVEPEVILECFADYKPGDKVNVFRVGPDRIGQIVVSGGAVVDALKNLERVKHRIKISLS